jgi:putative spermidine/putrescine transport system permease protein
MRRRRGRIAWWLVFLIGVLYFVLPLYATFVFSLKAKPAFSAYADRLSDPLFAQSLGYSMSVGIVTIFASLALIVPTAYWVQLRVPACALAGRVRDPPAVRHPCGRARLRADPGLQPTPDPLHAHEIGQHVPARGGYVVLSFPYMYRAVDAGLRRSTSEPDGGSPEHGRRLDHDHPPDHPAQTFAWRSSAAPS